MKTKITLFALVFLFVPSFASANIVFFTEDWETRDCSFIGVWNETTNTCTVNRDITGIIRIFDSGTTLDGAGHTLLPYEYQYGTGVEISNADDVTVKNLTVKGFEYGIYAGAYDYNTRKERIHIRDNTITESVNGINIYWFNHFDVSGNTVTGSNWAIDIFNADKGIVSDNSVSCGIDQCSSGISVFSVFSSDILNNSIEGADSGFYLSQVRDLSVKGNTISRTNMGFSVFADFAYRNLFSENIIRDSETGIIIFHESEGSGGVSSFAPVSKLFAFAKNIFSSTAFADTDDDNIFFKNDFINNTRDVSIDGIAPFRFFKLSPEGGNYWDKNTECLDADADGFCDAPYLINEGLGVSDNFPRVHKMGEVSSGIIGTETEDDGLQDAKGIANKTNFTFDVKANGTTALSDAVLWVNDGNITSHYPLAPAGASYSLTKTFPKGRYGYHFEANGGTARFPATGELSFTAGYSNVAFLPGLEATRLFSATGAELWEPEMPLHDNSQLYMNDDGTSRVSGIVAGDIIDFAYVPVKGNVYKSFMEKMNEMKTDGTIHDWQSFPYDWRYSVEDTVDSAMMQKFRALAETSDTGKVTIIAHSNGGLVAKELTIKLGDDAPKLADQMIFVASPEAGTPSAVGAILHGFQQGLPFDWFHPIISPEEARTLAKNMPSAYGLLPSANYFTYTDDPVITFADAPFLANWRAKYGTAIDSSEGLRNFLTDQSRASLPVVNDLNRPNIGNLPLFDKAAILHNSLDNWTPPAGVELTEIAGWGEETLKTIEYYQGVETGCKTVAGMKACNFEPVLQFKPIMTVDGDGTVVTSSALWTSGAKKFWVDLSDYNIFPIRIRKHADIFEVPSLLDFTKNILIRNNAVLPKYILSSVPSYDGNKTRLHFTLHSPLTLDLYDDLGNHTGVSPNGETEENIPGSRYFVFGDVQYISVPNTASTHLVMNGYTEGSFTLNVEETSGNTITDSTTFAGIPSSPTTVVTMDIPQGGDLTEASPLSVDENGDGTTDATLVLKSGETVLPDFVAPKTAVSVSGTKGTNGWYVSNASLSFSVTDEESGVKDTFHSLDNGEWSTTTPLIISKEGTTSLQFYSVDAAGNREATSTLEIKIDKTAPKANISVDPKIQDLKVEGTDISATSVTRNGDTYTVTDLAGHTTKLFFQKIFEKKRLVRAKLIAVSYDGGNKRYLPDTSVIYRWDLFRNTQTLSEQKNEVKRYFEIAADFDPKKNSTIIKTSQPGRKNTKQTFPGLRVLQLTVDKGTVGFVI